jgi:hypothetical protein
MSESLIRPERPDRVRQIGLWRGGEALPEPPSELSSGVGLVHSTDDAVEGNEMRRGKGPARKEPRRGERVRTQSRVALPSPLARVNAAARTAVRTRFTALLHHVNVEALERAFRRQRRHASAGIDGMTVAMYEQDLGAKLADLCARIHTGRYRPQPVRGPSAHGLDPWGVYIPKPMAGGARSACRRAFELKEEERAGKKTRLNWQNAQRRAEDLADRLKRRMTMQERFISSQPPRVRGGMVVVPRGLLDARRSLAVVSTEVIQREVRQGSLLERV